MLKNEYEIRGEITAIIITNRKGETFETLIDTEDLERVENTDLKWCLRWDEGVRQYYCHSSKYLGIVDGKPHYKTVILHNFLMDAKPKQHVDHKNHNTLDNRKDNLAVVDASLNAFNRTGANRNSTTGIRNVSYDKKNDKYLVQLQINGKNTVFGRFDNIEDAKKCAEENRNKYYPKVNVN